MNISKNQLANLAVNGTARPLAIDREKVSEISLLTINRLFIDTVEQRICDSSTGNNCLPANRKRSESRAWGNFSR